MSEAIERVRLRKIAHLGIDEIDDVSHLRTILRVIVTGKSAEQGRKDKATRAKSRKKDTVHLRVVS
jgi:hypothetical protein